MECEILLPYAALLRCKLDTTVIVVDGKDERRIGTIVRYYQQRGGWDYLISHLGDKPRAWLDQVRRVAETYSPELFRTPNPPKVKPYNDTLQFFGGHGNHRALAVAIRGITEIDVKNGVPVILALG